MSMESPILIVSPDKSHLQLLGQLSFETVPELYEQGIDLLSKQTGTIQLDMSQSTQSDSSVLALLIAWIRYTMSKGQVLELSGLSPNLENLMQLSGLVDFIPIV